MYCQLIFDCVHDVVMLYMRKVFAIKNVLFHKSNILLSVNFSDFIITNS